MFDKRDTDGVNGLYTDFRSDVVAAGAVDNGFDADRVIVLRRKGPEPQTDKEIAAIEYKPDYEGDGNHALLIQTTRRGIYDNLPEGVFHAPTGFRRQSKAAVVSGIRREHEKEFYIRRFFSLYEAEIERTRIDIRLSELRYDRPAKHRTFVDTMSRFWPVIRQMDTRTAVLFARSVPHISDIRNRYADIARTVTGILGSPVRIAIEHHRPKTNMKFPRLGAMRLGVNAALRGHVFERCATVVVEPGPQAMGKLLPQAPGYRVLETLLEIFMPAELAHRIIVRPKPHLFTSRLGDRNTPCYLGVNAKLKAKEINHES